jgi:hypothetical protein
MLRRTVLNGEQHGNTKAVSIHGRQVELDLHSLCRRLCFTSRKRIFCKSPVAWKRRFPFDVGVMFICSSEHAMPGRGGAVIRGLEVSVRVLFCLTRCAKLEYAAGLRRACRVLDERCGVA